MSLNIAFEVLTHLKKFLHKHFDNLKQKQSTGIELEAKKFWAKQIMVDTFSQLLFTLLIKGYSNPRRFQQLTRRKTQLLLVMYAKARRIRANANGTNPITTTWICHICLCKFCTHLLHTKQNNLFSTTSTQDRSSANICKVRQCERKLLPYFCVSRVSTCSDFRIWIKSRRNSILSFSRKFCKTNTEKITKLVLLV